MLRTSKDVRILVEGPILGRGELDNWEGLILARGAASARVKETLVKAGLLGKDIQVHYAAVDTDAMLADLQELDQLGDLLFQCFDDQREETLTNS
jgi:hypothetical protein